MACLIQYLKMFKKFSLGAESVLQWALHCPQQLAVGLRRETTPGNGQRSAGSKAPVDNRGQQSLSPPCRGSQFLLNHGWDNPHYESRYGNTRDLRECFLFVTLPLCVLTITDGCDIPKSSALQSCKVASVAKHFIARLIGLFLFVGDVMATRNNSSTNLIYLFINSQSSIDISSCCSKTIFRFFVNRSYCVRSPLWDF